MNITTQHEGDVTILALQGRIMSEADTSEFLDTVKNGLIDNRRKVVVDFSGVDWINSSGLGMLVAAFGLLRDANGQMKLARVNDTVYQSISLTRLDKVFEIHPTVEKAVVSLN